MLAWLKDIFRPIRRSDPLFGQLRYLRDGQVWEGWAAFPPVAGQVEVLMSGASAGPTEEQLGFFRAIEARYAALWPVIEKELRAAAAADPSHPESARFVLKGIDLPASIADEPSWELLYETEPPSWFFAVHMTGWAATNVSVEC